MCVKSHYIYNRYIKKSVLVDCGKCPSCLQQKAAHRANRIRNNVEDGQICLFVTLTYDNDFVPYVRAIDVYNEVDSLTVYRDATIRRVRVSDDYKLGYKKVKETYVLDTFWTHDMWLDTDNSNIKELNKKSGCIGICYYKDLQNFYKRLRQNLKRKYNFNDKFTTFSCSEYGGHSYRPHFHALIFIPQSCESIFRTAIVESWPYGDRDRTARFIEVARDCASYVSSYVNGGSLLHSLLSFPYFRQKHSYSKGFGLGVSCFNLPALLKKVESGDMRYYSKVLSQGESSFASFPVPKYVINRYFPIFKGFSRLYSDEIYNVILYPTHISEYRQRLEFSPDDERKIFIRLTNAYEYFHKVTGLNRYDYALYFVRVWTLYKSVVLMDSYNEVTNTLLWLDFYENIGDLKFGLVSAPSLTGLFDVTCFQSDPNKTHYRLLKESRLVPLYFKLCKQKVVTNQVMAEGLGLAV